MVVIFLVEQDQAVLVRYGLSVSPPKRLIVHDIDRQALEVPARGPSSDFLVALLGAVPACHAGVHFVAVEHDGKGESFDSWWASLSWAFNSLEQPVQNLHPSVSL